MTFGREKRRLLAALAFLAPIPLPFNEVIAWPILFVYCLLVLLCWQRIERGREDWLPNWALNLLGLLYFPIFFLEVGRAVQTSFAQFVQALLHLIMFVVVVKLFSLRLERDKWHLAVAIFFLFIGAMATSSHLAIALYLLIFLVLSGSFLARMAHLHVASTFHTGDDREAEEVSLRGPIGVGAFVALGLAIPIFALVPRFSQPFILGNGGGSGGLIRSTGFSDSVDLNLTSAIRGNRNVALRIQYGGAGRGSGEMRLKGAAYDRYRNRNWLRMVKYASTLVPRAGQVYELAEGQEVAEASIFLEPLRSASLILPMETLSVEMPFLPSLAVDPGGAILLPGIPNETMSYRVRLAPRPVFDKVAEPGGAGPLSGLDAEGITPQIAELAKQVMGEGEAAARIRRVEEHLLQEYSYTSDFVGRSGESPIEDFLFNHRSGHCELFASAMVLMLRSEGIPARFVTGFLGGEYNPLEDYYIVRQQNAHAWVEAFTHAEGWKVYDPTPPEGRPSATEQSLSLLLTQMYDYLIFRWDRYVLTFGADDQSSFVQRIRDRLEAMKEWLRKKLEGEEEESAPDGGAISILQPEPETPKTLLWWLLVLLPLASGLTVYWLRRPPASAEVAYCHLRRRLRGGGLELPDSLAPLRLESLAMERFPERAEDTRSVVRLYLRESYAGERLTQAQRVGLAEALRRLGREIRLQARR